MSLSDALDRITFKGVSPIYLTKFIQLLGGRSKFQGKTTREVVEIIRSDRRWRTAYGGPWCTNTYNKNRKEFRDLVGQANIYVSHSWNGLFLDFVDLLQNPNNFGFNTIHSNFHNQTTYFWIDIFCIDQVYPPGFDSDCMKKVIDEIGRTVLVMSPDVRNRLFCVWEVYWTLYQGYDLYVASSSLLGWSNGNSENAICSFREDEQKIRQLMVRGRYSYYTPFEVVDKSLDIIYYRDMREFGYRSGLIALSLLYPPSTPFIGYLIFRKSFYFVKVTEGMKGYVMDQFNPD